MGARSIEYRSAGSSERTNPWLNGGGVVHSFADFTLDSGTRQLLENGEEVHLSPKGFELLTILLSNRPRAVSKAELQHLLWPATFVQETNLASLIAEIRRALRDSASNPSFVRTVYGFGYRFVGEVTPEPTTAAAPSRTKSYLVFGERQIIVMEGANVIGRAPDATIPIDSPGISRYHARILVSNGEATLEDLRSKNGTHLNGTRIAQPVRLSDADEIRLGTVTLTFRIAAPMSPTETVAERPTRS
jgi:DNA-binding winged helix-turn-helix (wHTH) protein